MNYLNLILLLLYCFLFKLFDIKLSNILLWNNLKFIFYNITYYKKDHLPNNLA